MKKRYYAGALIPVLAFAIAGAGIASAHGGFGFGRLANATPDEIATRHQDMFADQAALFGISVEEAKHFWVESASFQAIAKAKGLTPEALAANMKTVREAAMKTELQTLVDKGILTQVQADARLKNMPQKKAHGGKGGFHRF